MNKTDILQKLDDIEDERKHLNIIELSDPKHETDFMIQEAWKVLNSLNVFSLEYIIHFMKKELLKQLRMNNFYEIAAMNGTLRHLEQYFEDGEFLLAYKNPFNYDINLITKEDLTHLLTFGENQD